MAESLFYSYLFWSWLALAGLTFAFLFFYTAPYGRHAGRFKGPQIKAKYGWILMEFPAALLPLLFFIWGDHRSALTSLVFILLWEFHYVHRTFIFPFRSPPSQKTMPWLIVISAIFFNVINAYLNGRWLFTLGPLRSSAWFSDIRFISGTALFMIGFAINFNSDAILFRLRRSSKDEYRIPQGGFYRWISCPNYFGEIIEWTGWAIATWSPGGLAFAIWTLANLAPRALANHKWYLERFPDYPPKRKALIPFIY